MKNLSRSLGLMLALSLVSCVTINIYFPAEEMRGAADKIVEEVWGDPNAPDTEVLSPQNPDSSILRLFLPATAHAAQDINLSTPKIRAIKQAIKKRSGALIGYLKAGNLGLTHDGLLAMRDTKGISLKQRAELNKLLKAENHDRLRLYKEIAVANGFPDKTAEVQTVFAESWQKQAGPDWFLKDANGNWSQK